MSVKSQTRRTREGVKRLVVEVSARMQQETRNGIKLAERSNRYRPTLGLEGVVSCALIGRALTCSGRRRG